MRNYKVEVIITREELEDYRDIQNEYSKVQKKLAELYIQNVK